MAGIGIEPNVELAAAAGLPVANGIVVDAFGRVGGREDVSRPATSRASRSRHSAASCASSTRITPRATAGCVGANMAGAADAYDHLPFFYSDLFDLGYEAVGHLDSRLETLVDGDRLTRRGRSTTSIPSAAHGESCSGICSAKSTQRAS